MSNIKISDLGQAGALTGAELIPIVQNNETVRTTARKLSNYVSQSFANNISVGIGLQLTHPTPTTTEISIGYVAQDAANLSNNILADATSTTKYPSVNAIKTYADGLVVGLLNDRGNYTPDSVSPGNYPSTGGSGARGAIQKGDIWFIDTVGYLGTTLVQVGASVRALVNNPFTADDWDILDAGLGYIPENVANKSNDGTLGGGSPSSVLYPTQAAVKAYVTNNTSRTLQSVLDAGNTALNQSIELDSATSYTYLDTNSFYINDNNSEGYYSATDAYVYDANNSNYIEMYASDSNPVITVYNGATNDNIQLRSDSLRYINSGFTGRLSSSVLTSSQTWTLPNASGTIALTTDIISPTLQTVLNTNHTATEQSIELTSEAGENSALLSGGITGTSTPSLALRALGVSVPFLNLGIYGLEANNDNNGSNIKLNNQTESYLELINNLSSPSEKRSKLTTTSLSFTNTYVGTLQTVTLTNTRTWTLPDKSGTIALEDNTAFTGTKTIGGQVYTWSKGILISVV